MQSLERVESFGARLLVRHNVDILAELAEHDPQALRDLRNISLLLKSVTEEARERSFACEPVKAEWS
jgi:hypothetical protein